MFSKEWEGKVAIDKHGRAPDASYDPLIKIIHQIPRRLIFDPFISALELYPKERRRGKDPPRPMNSFMILTLNIRKVASSYVELGDGKACTKIAQLIRWGCSKEDWAIFLNLQKEFKKIHSQMFPQYDYRPKGSIPSPETNFHVLNPENYGEMILTQKKKSKANHNYQRLQHRNTLPVVQSVQQSIPTSPPISLISSSSISPSPLSPISSSSISSSSISSSPLSPSLMPLPEYSLPDPSNLEISQNELDWNQIISEGMLRAIADQLQLFNPSMSSSVVSSSHSFTSPTSSDVYQSVSSSPSSFSFPVVYPTSSSPSFPPFYQLNN